MYDNSVTWKMIFPVILLAFFFALPSTRNTKHASFSTLNYILSPFVCNIKTIAFTATVLIVWFLCALFSIGTHHFIHFFCSFSLIICISLSLYLFCQFYFINTISAKLVCFLKFLIVMMEQLRFRNCALNLNAQQF